MTDTANPILPLDFSDLGQVPDAVRPDDIALLLHAAPGGAGLVAGVLAVVGGGAAFRLYSQWMKNKHEENMARLKDEATKRENEHALLVGQIEALQKQVAALESKTDAASDALFLRLTEWQKQKDKKRAAKPKRTKKATSCSRNEED